MNESTFQAIGHEQLNIVGHAVGHDGAPPVLFLHGGGQTRHAWAGAMSSMAQLGWRAVAVDLRGHGDSDWSPSGDYRLASIAKDVEACAIALDQPPVLVGASLGGLASMLYLSEQHAHARALVLVDVVIAYEPEGARHIREFMLANPDGFASIDEAADAVTEYSTTRRPARREGLMANLRQGQDGRYRWHWDPRFLEGRTAADVAERRRALEQRVSDIDVPVLLVRGERSRVVSDYGVEHLRRLVPQTEVVTVEGAGHMVAGDQNDVFASHIVGFLDRLPAINA